MISWIKKNRLEVIIILIIVALAAFLRLYRIGDYMTFLGDEGRDALMVKRILVDHDFPLLGPPTSVGNIYLGPLYYYLMAVSMAISWLNPVAAAFMVALIGTATVVLVYLLGRRWFGASSALIVAALYTISPINILYSRSSWNPDPAPFFSLLAILGFDQAHKTRNYLWLILTGVGVAAALQMHYLALILIPIFIILWLVEVLIVKSPKRFLLLGTLGSVVIFLLFMLPLIIFDLKYNLMNSHAMVAMFTSREAGVTLNLLGNLQKMSYIYQDRLIGQYLAGGNIFIALIVAGLVLIPVVITIKNIIKKRAVIWHNWLLVVWLIVGILGVSFYKGSVYVHYLGFLNPAPFLLIGSMVGFLQKSRFIKQWQIKISFTLALVFLIAINLWQNPLRMPPNNQLQHTQAIARFIISKSDNQPFNFALISKNNYDAAYQFYLEQYGHKPKVVPVEITGQLFVVCEDTVCQPVGNAKYEISGFGWTKIAWEEEVMGVRVYKLVSYFSN